MRLMDFKWVLMDLKNVILNYESNKKWNDTLNMKLKPFTRFVKNTDSFSNETAVCCSEMHNSFAVDFFGTIFFGEIEQNRQYWQYCV